MKLFALLTATALLIASHASAQVKNVTKTISTNGLVENLVVPSGKTLTINAGGSIVNNGTATGFTANAVWGGITGTLSSQIDLQTALDAKLATSTAASTYQPLDAGLTALAGLADASGVLTNNGSGTLSYTATSTGGNTLGLDAGKIAVYGTSGELTVASAVRLTSGPTVMGIWFGDHRLASSGSGFPTKTWTLPNVTGTLITTGDTGSVTNTMLAGSIALSKLAITGTPDGTKYLRDDGTWQSVTTASSTTLDAYTHEILGAYSTARRLLTGFDAKTSFRARESGANAEADIPVTSSGDTTATLTTLVGSGSGFIKSFRNQLTVPGAWPEFYNATTTTQMRLVDTGTRDTINGKTAIFNPKDGTARTLACTSTSTGNSWAAILVARYTGTAAEQAIMAGSGTWYLGFHNSNGKIYLAGTGSLGSTLLSYDNGHANASWAKYADLPMVYAVRVKDGLQELYINGWKAGTTTVAGNYPLSLTNLGYSGTSTITWKGQLAEMVLFSSADADGFIPTMRDMVTAYAAKPLVVLAGDSLTTGSGATGSPLQTYGQQLRDSSDYIIHLVATIGHRVDQVTTDLNGANNTNYSPRYAGDTTKNATVCWCGVNDLGQGASIATLQARLSALWAQQRAAGFKVVACTLTGCINSGSLVQQDLIDLNAWIRTQSSSYDALADLGASATIGVGQHLNTTYFHTDNVHLNSTGYGVVASLVKAALDSVYP